jgi:hypothetical protein
MKTTILSIAAIAFALFTFNTNISAQSKTKTPKDKILAGKVFTVELTETTNKKVGKTENDEISFKSEKLNSKIMAGKNHFPAALYTVSVDSSSTPPTITFSSEGKDSDGQDIKWDGTVTGDDIEGSAVVSKKGKTKMEYAYTGSIKTKGAPKK